MSLEAGGASGVVQVGDLRFFFLPMGVDLIGRGRISPSLLLQVGLPKLPSRWRPLCLCRWQAEGRPNPSPTVSFPTRHRGGSTFTFSVNVRQPNFLVKQRQWVTAETVRGVDSLIFWMASHNTFRFVKAACKQKNNLSSHLNFKIKAHYWSQNNWGRTFRKRSVCFISVVFLCLFSWTTVCGFFSIVLIIQMSIWNQYWLAMQVMHVANWVLPS